MYAPQVGLYGNGWDLIGVKWRLALATKLLN